MVQLKYFGDSRDYFKYDLIAFLLDNDVLENYAFIPMLTNHRDDGEGNKTPKHIEGIEFQVKISRNRNIIPYTGHLVIFNVVWHGLI